MNALFSGIWRAVRVAVGIGAGAAIASVTANPALVMVAPIISGAGKMIRESNPKKFWWLPF